MISKISNTVDIAAITSPLDPSNPDAFTITDRTTGGISLGDPGVSEPGDSRPYYLEPVTSDNLDIVANIDSVVISAARGTGDDRIFLRGGNNDVVGGPGIKQVTCGTGTDVVNLGYDTADSWLIVSNFHSGDVAQLFSTQFNYTEAYFAQLPGVSSGGVTWEWQDPTTGAHEMLSLAGYSESDIGTRLTVTPAGYKEDTNLVIGAR